MKCHTKIHHCLACQAPLGGMERNLLDEGDKILLTELQRFTQPLSGLEDLKADGALQNLESSVKDRGWNNLG